MAGNKNSGRKPKQRHNTLKDTSPTRAKSSRLQSQKGRLTSQKSSKTTGKKTQVKIDKHVKKVVPASAITKTSPKKTKVHVELPSSKISSPKKPKECVKEQDKGGESKQFNCPYCNQGFSRKYDMEKHSRKV